MNHSIRTILFLLFFSSSFLSAVVIYDYRAFNQYEFKSFKLDLRSGTSYSKVAKQLSEMGGAYWHWRVLGKLTESEMDLKAGEYQFEGPIKPSDILEKMRSGQVIQYQFRLLEGWTFKQFKKALSDNEHLINDLSNDDSKFLVTISDQYKSPEGWFFPDTYYFVRNTSAQDLMKRAFQLMDAKLNQAWNERDVVSTKWLETPYEALILASIIEKETAKVEEMPQISSVFLNRLKKKMRLQTDPTVIYGIGDAFDGDIRRKDLRTYTPFNTYVIKGLPPTPICMPGWAAIEAALNPDQTEYLYFVADGSGGHYFSKTLQEHESAVDRYILKKAP